MGTRRQKNRREPALAWEGRGEAPTAHGEGIEVARAMREAESPAGTLMRGRLIHRTAVYGPVCTVV